MQITIEKMMNKPDLSLKESLLNYQTSFDEESLYVQLMTTFIDSTPNCWSRSNLAGHITGSAWVVNQEYSEALLIHHLGLNKWLQPGGHVEPEDLTILDTARRELKEECGIEKATLITDIFFDLDIHIIPQKKDVPTHLHYDIRFGFVVSDADVQLNDDQVTGFVWKPIESLIGPKIQQSIRRMALKTIQLRVK